MPRRRPPVCDETDWSPSRWKLRFDPVAVNPQIAVESDARSRILEAAYELFSRRGIRAVGIDAIIRESGVARMTLYRHFKSKDELVLAYLELREARWTK